MAAFTSAGALPDRAAIEAQINAAWNAIKNNTKTSISGDSFADLHNFRFNDGFGHCHVFTLHQLCYMDIVSYNKQAALDAGVEAGWNGSAKLGAGGVLEAGLWTNGIRNADGSWSKNEASPVTLRDGTPMQGDYRNYGMTLKTGVTEKGRIRSGVTSITNGKSREYIRTWDPKIPAINKIFREYMENLPSPTYNILLEFGPSKPHNIVFGHIMFIHAKLKDENGVDWLYFMESHSRMATGVSENGLPPRPAQGEGLQRVTVDDFVSRYSVRAHSLSNGMVLNGLFYGGMYFETAPDTFTFENRANAAAGTKLSGGLFGIIADYTYPAGHARAGQKITVILNLRGSGPHYEVNQWAPFTQYDENDTARWTATANCDGVSSARYAVPAHADGVAVDFSTLNHNGTPGYRGRFENIRAVEFAAPAGYKMPPKISEMRDGIWVVVNEPDVFRFQKRAAVNSPYPLLLSGGLFALAAEYREKPHSAPQRVILNLRAASAGPYQYEINQWAAYAYYNANEPERWAATQNNDGKDKARYVVPTRTGTVTIDLSTLSRNNTPGFRERFSNFAMVEIEAPPGYAAPPVRSGMVGNVWVIVNDAEPLTGPETEQ